MIKIEGERKSWRKELKVGKRQKAKKGVRWRDVGGGGNKHKMVPEIKTLSLWNSVYVAQFPCLHTRVNLYVLHHEFKWSTREGAILTELNVHNAKWEETAKQKSFLFYFQFSSSSSYSTFLLSYLISGLNFYPVLTHLAQTWKRKKKDWNPTCKNSWGWFHRAFSLLSRTTATYIYIYIYIYMYCRNKLLFLVWGALVSWYLESIVVC